MSPREAAARLAITPGTLRRWAASGELPSVATPGGHRRFRAADVDALAKRTRAAADPPSVVVIDDDPQFSSWLVAVLKGRMPELRVSIAVDGFAGGLLVAREQPRVVLLDLSLRGLDGFEVCKRVRADESLRACEVVAVTGLVTPDRVERIRGAGALAVLAKPFTSAELFGVLAPLLLASPQRPELEIAP